MPDTQTQTATAFEADPGVDNFAVSSTSGVGNDLDKTNDFASATGGSDAFSETPNARTMSDVEQDQSNHSKLDKVKDALHLKK